MDPMNTTLPANHPARPATAAALAVSSTVRRHRS
jgi:hypothetical protein